MTQCCDCIRVTSYNCRGWNSSVPFVKSLLHDLDLLLIQEHWLFEENLASLNISPDFASFGVSGMDSSVLLSGRPYGGCGFLIRKSLLPFISQIRSGSNRFCALIINDNGNRTLVINVYLPTNYGNVHSEDLFMESLAELKGLIDSLNFHNVIIAGDFNVDLFSSSSRRDQLMSFMSDLNLCSVDLFFRAAVKYTYERDDGAVTSWPDHILTMQHLSSTITEVAGVHSACNLSDHVPLAFSVNINLNSSRPGPSRCPASRSSSCAVDWSRVTHAELDRYIETVRVNLPVLSAELLDCCAVNCVAHQDSIDVFCNQLLECVQSAASLCLPLRSQRAKAIPGWNEHVRRYMESACLWNTIWVDSGCPRSGVLFDLRKQSKKAYKYAVRRAKRRQSHIASEKLGMALCNKQH